METFFVLLALPLLALLVSFVFVAKTTCEKGEKK